MEWERMIKSFHHVMRERDYREKKKKEKQTKLLTEHYIKMKTLKKKKFFIFLSLSLSL